MSRICIPLPAWVRVAASPADGCVDDTCDVLVTGDDGEGARDYRTAAAIGREVASLIRAGRISGTVRVWALSACAAAGVPPAGDPVDVAAAVLAYATQTVQYARDPVRAELVQGATETIRTGAGDCEDFTALVGAACESLGLASRVVLVRYAGTSGGPDAYDHVFPEIDVTDGAAPRWLAADATLWGASGIPASLGLDPRTLSAVRGTLTIDPYAAASAAPDAMRSLSGLFGLDFGFGFGGTPSSFGSNQFGSAGGFGSSQFGGAGGFGSNQFGGASGFGLGTGGSSFGLGAGPIKQPPGGGGISLDDVLRVITTLSPIVAALFGRDRQYAASRGAIYNPTTAAAPPGYRRLTDPTTGSVVDVPNDLAEDYAQQYADEANAAAGGGVSGTTLLLVGGAGVAAFLYARRKR